ncbi:flavohemoprotein [Streptomyces piniterrae]|uniref:nitric oxide dioxygenase n=1 Tax=Streptomyces piniterrae TaxID=2571125 RepID=A0A4U0N973_9ACTN|nr:globin domain-containing protein [Streptomyces piniterrae]TJZ50226.1 flavohemoprotein [Streptomyces piniterrae]
MDAPTTTSADSGSSDGNSGAWGWFTPPSKKSSAEQQERQNGQDGQGGQQDQDGRGDPNDGNQRNAGNSWNGQDDRERIPSRPVNPIRPVGTAAERERVPEPRQGQQPQQPPQQDPRQDSAAWPGTGGGAAARIYAGPPPGGPSYAEQSAPSGHAAPRRDPERPWEREAVRERDFGGNPEPAPELASPFDPIPVSEPIREPEPVHQSARAAGAPTGAAATGTSPGTGSAAATASSAPSAPSVFTPAERPAAAERASTAEPTLEAVEASASSATPASPDAILIRRTMAEIEPIADKVTSYFYALLFVQHPDLRALFPASMDTQRDRLFKALLTAAKHVDDADVLTEYLSHLGRGHRKYGTLPDHYPAVGECLLGALSRYATSSWDPETEAAWVRAYTAVSQIMIDAAAENEAVAPAWWQAEVVSHELRTPDIAVVTVRPDQPYPFLAGQYTSLETPWWPRVWRHYSFASAPRSDGLLSFHIKAVPAGWVSNAMVHRARPGDVIRLGAPGGSMTVDHTTSNGLLCVGGGTGIAPIKALVEDVAERGARRPVEVFYGARSDHDLYDLDTMLRMEQSHPWLSVRPVVATGPPPSGMNCVSGQLPDAVRQYGPWREYDAYLSGPPGLIRSGVDALVGVGIPSERIRHDSIEELVSTGD